MDTASLAAQLRRIADQLEGVKTNKPLPAPGAPAGGGQPAFDDSDVPPGYRKGLVKWYGTKATSRGSTMARVGIGWLMNNVEESKFYPIFDEALLARVDPLMKGSTVVYATRPGKEPGDEIITDIRVTRAPGGR